MSAVANEEMGVGVDKAIERLARMQRLLVACDYDGTLAPIVDDPTQAFPVRESIVALRMLSEMPGTHVALISGRALADLSRLSGLSESVHLVGSHGSEFDHHFMNSLTPTQSELRERILEELNAIAGKYDGITVEEKPASIALHYRNVSDEDGELALAEAEQGPAARDGVQIKRGKKVIELSVVRTNKGTALQVIRQRVAAHCALFIGDDVTDEDTFETLRGPDIGIKVGDGDTAAHLRVSDPVEVARLLAKLSQIRQEWVGGDRAVPIEHHTLLSDQRTVALVTPSARVVWMCAPRIDSPALFAEIIGGPTAGYFSVEPVSGGRTPVQMYEENTLVTHTDFGTFTVTDALDCAGGRVDHRAGRTDLLRVIEGSGRVRIEFAPRLDFGRMLTSINAREGGLEVANSPEPLVLFAPGVEWQIESTGEHDTAAAEIDLDDHPEGITLALRLGSASLRSPRNTMPGSKRLDETRHFWREWCDRLTVPDEYRSHVLRSALTLRALVQGPTGAIAAAATTSLPESIGGVRNWDYRYCWPRDAAIAATSLVRLGSLREAMHLLDWMLVVIENSISPDRLQPLYTVGGEQLTTEGEIGELAGYAGSRPVRTGNAASRQIQLDVFGPVVELIYQLALRDAPLTPEHWRVVEAMVSAVTVRWHEPDHGIWELRSYRRHHIHSKTMCWLTMDRAIKIAELLHDGVSPLWPDLRKSIGSEVLERGYDRSLETFTVAYDQEDTDAAALWVGLSGLLDPSDERFAKTVKAVEKDLLKNGGVYRYLFDDGLPGHEGTFHLCTCWYIQSLILLGQRDRAKELFEQFISRAGPTGLLPEEFDTEAERSLGNHPQAYSHAGVIDCALMLAGDS